MLILKAFSCTDSPLVILFNKHSSNLRYENTFHWQLFILTWTRNRMPLDPVVCSTVQCHRHLHACCASCPHLVSNPGCWTDTPLSSSLQAADVGKEPAPPSPPPCVHTSVWSTKHSFNAPLYFKVICLNQVPEFPLTSVLYWYNSPHYKILNKTKIVSDVLFDSENVNPVYLKYARLQFLKRCLADLVPWYSK